MDPQLNPYAPPTASVDQAAATADEQDYVLASRGARFLGAFLDNLVLVALLIPTFFLFDPPRIVGGGNPLLQIYTTMAVPFLIYVGIQWTLIATSGQSIGKKILGTKIVRLDGSPCGFVHGVILRSWIIGALGMIPYIGSIVGLVNALMIFGEEKRCGHDMIAGTRVIVAPIHG